jgi:hypothetical protein
MSEGRSQYQQEKDAGIRLPSGQTRLTKLSGKHLRLINYHLQGLKAREIAEILDVTPAWISKILNDPLVKAKLQERFVDIDNELLVNATMVVSGAMKSDDEAIALRAADMVWRSRGRYEKKGDDRPTAEDVVQRMLAMAQEGRTVTLTASASGPPGANAPPLIEGKLK